jgi:hypothetical protein
VSHKKIAALLISLFVVCLLNIKKSQATEGEVILDKRTEYANVLPLQFQKMSEFRINSILHSDRPEHFKSENWKAHPNDRLRMLESLIAHLPDLSRNELSTLLGSDKIVGGVWGKTEKADRFLLNNARCGATVMSVLEVDYQVDKAYRYRLLYFPEGVSANTVDASDWYSLTK